MAKSRAGYQLTIYPVLLQPAPVPRALLVHVRARVLVAGLAAAACMALAVAPLRATYQSFSGTAIHADAMVVASEAVAEPIGGRILVPIVASRSVSMGGALRGWLNPDEDVARSPGDTLEERDLGARHMERAARVAAQLASAQVAAPLAEGVQLDTRGFGGPSAGLAFALELVDQLSPGDLTRGLDVAVTGELTEYGEVVAVGGMRHKAIAAQDAGADIFIVPAANFLEATAVRHPFRVVPVTSVDEALRVLRALG